jgi:hypothetical protein
VELRRGRNQFDITALDPETGKTAETPARVFITVPFLVIEAPDLDVSSPSDGSAFENGAVPVSGMVTNAHRVVVSATYLGPAEGEPVPSVAPSGSPAAGPTVTPVTADVADDGAFTTPLDLSTGRWSVVVTATSDNGKIATVTREVTIQYKGVTLVIEVKGSRARAWLKVWVDGKVSNVTGDLGKVFNAGKVLTFTAKESIEVRTGASSVTYFTLNGKDLGRFSDRGNPETWLFHPPDEPKKTNRR